jgi:hypothetical protein
MKFLQFLHQIVFGVQTARGVHQQITGLARQRGGNGVVRDGGGVGAVRAGDNLDLQPLAPELDLLNRRRTKRVASRQQDSLALSLK